MTWMRTSNGQGGLALRFSKSPKIRRTVRAATAQKIPKDISGISRRTFLKVRNQEGSEEILRNCDETWRGTIIDLPASPIVSVLDPERKVQRSHSGSSTFQAVLADLRQVAPDLVVHGGDLAYGGARPAEIIDQVRTLGWPGAAEIQTRCFGLRRV
jgi:hypothetical protein